MTVKLYEENVYEKRCMSNVIDLIEKDGKKFVILDQTLFFPEGGGQPSDIGYISESRVKYVFEKTGVVFHEVDEFPKERKVECNLDWEKRMDSMQQHCGEHILSGVVYREYGGVNKGFHLGDDYVTIDIDIETISDEMKENIEYLSNLAIYENNPVNTVIVNSRDEANSYNLRKAVTVDENIRVVTIKNTDAVACCGTHPSRTGEVGIVKILKIEKNKGMSRIYFKCGKRALDDYKFKHTLLGKIGGIYSANENNLLEKIGGERVKTEKIKADYKKLKDMMIDKWAEDHYSSKDSIIEGTDDFDAGDFKFICKKMTEKGFSGAVLLYSNADFSVMGCNFEDESVNWGQIFKDNIRNFGGAGGGSKAMAQGKFNSVEELLNFVNHISPLLTKE